METNAIRKVLRSEITWVVFTAGFLWGFVTTVVLPLQRLQIQIAQIQTDLSSQNKKYDDLSTVVNTLINRVSIVETRLDNKIK